MPGRSRTKRIERERLKAETEGRDPDQVERDLRQEMGMAPLDKLDKEQRAEKGMPLHPELDPNDKRPMDAGLTEEDLGEIDVDAKGHQLSKEDRLKRDAAIMQLLKRGISPVQVGAQFALTTRQVQRIKNRYRDEEPDVQNLDPGDIVRDTLDNYEAAIEELALVAARTDHGATKVGAIRVRLEALRGRIELLQAVGVVPNDLGQIRVMDDARAVAKQIAEVFDRYGVSEEIQFAVVDVIEGRTPELPEGDTIEDAVVVEDT